VINTPVKITAQSANTGIFTRFHKSQIPSPHFKRIIMIDPTTKFERFKTALQQIHVPPPAELAARIAALPPAGTLPNPGTTWLFISLMRYRARQQWAHEQLQTYLPGFFVGLGDPAQLPEGMPIRGMPDWQLYIVFDEWGAIAHRGTREHIVLNRRHPHYGEYIIFPHDLRTMVPSSSLWDIPGRLVAATRGSELQAAVDELVAARILLKLAFMASLGRILETRTPTGCRRGLIA